MYVFVKEHKTNELRIIKTQSNEETIERVNQQSTTKAVIASIGIISNNQPVLGLLKF